MLALFLFSSALTWAACEEGCDQDYEDEDYEPRIAREYYKRPRFDSDTVDNRLRDEASWPSKNQDPLLESLMN